MNASDFVKQMDARIYVMWFLGLVVAPFIFVKELAVEIWQAGIQVEIAATPTYVMRTPREPGWALREYRQRLQQEMIDARKAEGPESWQRAA